MNRLRRTLTSSNAIALVALFVALGGTAGAAGVKLITGADIKNGSITGADVKSGSLSGSDLRRSSVTGIDIRNGSLHLGDFAESSLDKLLAARRAGATGAAGTTGPQGPAGAPATLQSISATGARADVSNYQDGDALITANAGEAGYYLAIASGTVTNTGSNDDYLNCGFDVAGAIAGAAGFSTTAGNAVSGSSVTIAPTTTVNEPVKFVCMGSGVTTFDVTNLRMKLIKLADQ